MLRLEVRMRTCDYILEQLGRQVDTREDNWMPLIEPLVQIPIVKGFGYDNVPRTVMILQTAAQRWPHDDDFKTIPFWVRANRARNGDLEEGSLVPVMKVHPLGEDGTIGSLELLHDSDGLPDILVAGSIT